MTSAWSSGGNLNTARERLAAAGTLAAGLSAGGNTGSVSAVTEEYDGSSWSNGGNLSQARYAITGAGTQTAGLTFNGTNGISIYNKTEEYDGSSWSNGGNTSTTCYGPAGAGTQTAGLRASGATALGGHTTTSEEYDGSSWSSGGTLSTARRELAGCGTQTDALCFGGITSIATYRDECEEYDGSSWSSGGDLSTARGRLAGAGAGGSSGISAGGTTGSVSDVTEQYDGASWSTVADLSTARSGLAGGGTATAAFACGGNTGSVTNVTEEWSETSSQTPVSLAGSLTASGALVKAVSRSVVGSTTTAGALLKAASRAVTGSATVSGALLKAAHVILPGQLTPAGALSAVKVILVAIAGVITGAGEATRHVLAALSGSIGGAGALTRSVRSALAGAVTAVGALANKAAKSLGGAISGSSVLQTGRVLRVGPAGFITASGATLRGIGKGLVGSSAASGGIVKGIYTALAGSSTLSSLLDAVKGRYVSLEGSITASGLAVKTAIKAAAGTVTAAGALARNVAKGLAGSSTASGALTRKGTFYRALSGSLTAAGQAASGFTKLLTGLIRLAGSLSRWTNTQTPQPPSETLEVDVLIGGVSYVDRLITATLRWTEYEGGQVGPMSLEIEDTDDNLTLSEWQEAQVVLDGVVVWGGYVVRLQPGLTAGGNRRWALQCESYATLFNRTPVIRKTYTNQTPAQIIASLFSEAGLSDFDTSSQVGTFSAIDSFAANGEKLTDLLDRLALLADASWSVGTNKDVVFQAGDGLTEAPFSIAPLGTADFSNSYPPSGSPTPDINATDIRNRVTVYGGEAPSDVQSQSFTGDGATTRFTLSYAPVHEIVLVTVDGVMQWHGYDFYDTAFNDYDCLVDYTLGTVRWLDPPAVGAAIVVQYRYGVKLTVAAQSDDSYAQYGRWFDYEIRDGSLTTEAICLEAANAVLEEYAFASEGASLDVEWFGPRAGQRIQIEFPVLNLSGYYVIRQATIELARSSRRAFVTIKVGGRSQRLSRVVGGEINSGSLTGPSMRYLPTKPDANTSGEVGTVRLRNRIEIIDPLTTFVSESDYGNATGLVVLFDSTPRKGKLLALNSGTVKTELSEDGITAQAGTLAGWKATTDAFYKLDSGTPTGSPNNGITLETVGGTNGKPVIKVYDGATLNAALGNYESGTYGVFAIEGNIAGFSISGTKMVGGYVAGEATGMQSGAGSTKAFFAGALNGYGDSATYYVTAAGALFASSADIAGAIKASSGYISGSFYVGTADPRIHIDGANKLIESTNFVSGTSGLRMSGATGDAEFNNITARGSITTAVFVKSLITAFAGSQVVSKSASRLYANLTVGSSMTLDVDKQDGGAPFANGDIIRIKDGALDVWATVNTGTDQTSYWRYTATRQSGSSSGTIYKGAAVVDYGQSGDGYVMLSADGANRPWVSIATHSGSPWSSITERARLGNLNGISDASGYGLWTDNGYFTGTVYANAGSIDGALTIGTSGGIYQGSGSFATPTTGLKIWNSSGTGKLAGYNGGTIQWYGDTDGRLYAGAGKVRIDAGGVNFLGGSSSPDGATLTWKDATDTYTFGQLWAYSNQTVVRAVRPWDQGINLAALALLAKEYTGSSTFNEAALTVSSATGAGSLAFYPSGTGGSTALEATSAGVVATTLLQTPCLKITDGITAPATASGYALIYVDTSDGDLKVKFGDGTVKTLATDS